MLGQQLDLPDRAYQIGFQAHDLVCAGGNPGTPLQVHRKRCIIHIERLLEARFIRALPEMDKPCRLAMPVAKPFTDKIEIASPVRMEYERQRRQAPRSDVAGEISLVSQSVTVLVNLQNSLLRLRNLHLVV